MMGTAGPQAWKRRKEKKKVSVVHRLVWPGPVTNETEDPQTRTPGEGKRGRAGR